MFGDVITDIGFTGTQNGMTEEQKEKVREILQEQFDNGAKYFHHGDCVGADEDAHTIALDIGYKVFIHPPDNPSKRAHCKEGVVLSMKPYLDRNKDIVDIADLLVATPKGRVEELRSGTWSTIRYARKKKLEIEIIYGY